jgi:hypothetical protein
MLINDNVWRTPIITACMLCEFAFLIIFASNPYFIKYRKLIKNENYLSFRAPFTNIITQNPGTNK